VSTTEAPHSREGAGSEANSAEVEEPARQEGGTEAQLVRKPDDRFFARFGTFIATLPEVDAERRSKYEGFHDRLVKALRDDSHVTAIASAKFKLSFTHQWVGYPTNANSTAKQVLSGSDHFHGFDFEDAVAFEVSDSPRHVRRAVCWCQPACSTGSLRA